MTALFQCVGKAILHRHFKYKDLEGDGRDTQDDSGIKI
jgi:hypothetical protein